MQIYGIQNLTQRQQVYQLLAAAAQTQWGLSPLPGIRRESGGKPFFPGLEGRFFNLSHSGTLALCALDSSPVGVDIQVVKNWRPTLPGRVCSPEELDWLGPPDAATYWARFTQLWALKEARSKQYGTGLRGRIPQIRVPLPHSKSGPYQLDGLWFRCYNGDGWRGAACGLTPPPVEICWLSLDCPSP